jgi:hypothetical protein
MSANGNQILAKLRALELKIVARLDAIDAKLDARPKAARRCQNVARDLWASALRNKGWTWPAIWDELVIIGPSRAWNIPADGRALYQAWARLQERQRRQQQPAPERHAA